jgi:hypothetical protein
VTSDQLALLVTIHQCADTKDRNQSQHHGKGDTHRYQSHLFVPTLHLFLIVLRGRQRAGLECSLAAIISSAQLAKSVRSIETACTSSSAPPIAVVNAPGLRLRQLMSTSVTSAYSASEAPSSSIPGAQGYRAAVSFS